MAKRALLAFFFALGVATSFVATAHGDDTTLSSTIDSATTMTGQTITRPAEPNVVTISTNEPASTPTFTECAIAPGHRSSSIGAIGLLLCALLALERRS